MSLLRATEKIPNGIPTFPQTPNSRRQTDQRRRRMPPSITPSPNSRTRNTPGYEPHFLHPHHPAWMLPKNDGFSVAELKQDQKRKHSFHCHGLWQTLGGKISQPVFAHQGNAKLRREREIFVRKHVLLCLSVCYCTEGTTLRVVVKSMCPRAGRPAR